MQYNYPYVAARDLRVRAKAARSREDFEHAPFVIRRRNRVWELIDESGNLICLTVYKRGAKEVARRLSGNR